MSIIEQRYFLETLLAFEDGGKSFNELLRELKISPGTLSRRIKDLKKLGLVEPFLAEEEITKAKYRLTPKGADIVSLAKNAKEAIAEIDDKLKE